MKIAIKSNIFPGNSKVPKYIGNSCCIHKLASLPKKDQQKFRNVKKIAKEDEGINAFKNSPLPFDDFFFKA